MIIEIKVEGRRGGEFFSLIEKKKRKKERTATKEEKNRNDYRETKNECEK